MAERLQLKPAQHPKHHCFEYQCQCHVILLFAFLQDGWQKDCSSSPHSIRSNVISWSWMAEQNSSIFQSLSLFRVNTREIHVVITASDTAHCTVFRWILTKMVAKTQRSAAVSVLSPPNIRSIILLGKNEQKARWPSACQRNILTIYYQAIHARK